jgi:hypothetical protein
MGQQRHRGDVGRSRGHAGLSRSGDGATPNEVVTLADANQSRNTAEKVMWDHYQRTVTAGLPAPTGADLDKVANTNNYGRAVLRKWRRARKVE